MGEGSRFSSAIISQEDLAKCVKISPDFYTEFANHVRIAVSETDVRLFFGDGFPTSTGEISITENFSVALAPQHAKAVLINLTRIVEGYEKLFGEIKSPTPITSATLNTLLETKTKEESK